MRASAELKRLIDAVAPYWAGEAEVIRAYFHSPKRTRATDLDWLARQCRKEFWDSFDGHKEGLFIGPMKVLVEAGAAEKIDRGFDRHEALDLAEGAFQEFAHYVAFADAYDEIRTDDDPPIDPYRLRDLKSWAENEALSDLRAKHRQDHGEIGARAARLTEGGYYSLFSEGMLLKGRGGADDAIAVACAKVYDDEFEHMLKGIAGLDKEGLRPADWALLGTLAVEQMKLRLPMRNAQFAKPTSDTHIAELATGKAVPVIFDYTRAGFEFVSGLVAHEMVTTAFTLDNYKVVRNLGVARGIIVRSRSVIGTIGASLQTLVGGNISIYTRLCEQAREDAFSLMLQHAAEMGANAVIGARYDATEITSGVSEVLAYGTAVVVERA